MVISGLLRDSALSNGYWLLFWKAVGAFGNNLFKFSENLTFSASASFSPTANGCLVVSASRNFCAGIKSFSISSSSSSDIEGEKGLYAGKPKGSGGDGGGDGGCLKPPGSPSSSSLWSSWVFYQLKSLNLFNCSTIFKPVIDGAASDCFLICFSLVNLPDSIWVNSVPIVGLWVSNFALSLMEILFRVVFLQPHRLIFHRRMQLYQDCPEYCLSKAQLLEDIFADLNRLQTIFYNVNKSRIL